MQGTTDQDKNYVWNESVLENASAVSFSTAINRTLGSPPQSDKISDNPERTGISEEMERANETPLIPLFKQTTELLVGCHRGTDEKMFYANEPISCSCKKV